ncbi:MAG: hypothetical protein GY796_03745 [Chloroflexi bacterium]|nr:hypothetical protein [Chloroflexota bacterium]
MNTYPNRKQEAVEDIFFGQVVIIWARWFVIAAGIIYALWISTNTAQLSVAILLLGAIVSINFFVHGRYLMEKPINRSLLLGLSFIDTLMVSVIVFAGPGQHGIDNYLFIFYYPLLLAFAFVFPQTLTAIYTVITLLAYLAVCVVATPQLITAGPVLETLIMRLITMAAVGGLGTYYWRIQRERWHALEETFQSAT